MNTEIAEIKNFIRNFNKLESELLQTRLSDDIRSIIKLFKEYAPLSEKVSLILEQTAPTYNIFDILHIKRYETKVHTPFLMHLLNPNESHRQNRLFFDSFMEMVLGNVYLKEQVSQIAVFEEYSFAKGRIDILIYYQQAGINKSLVIENKIDHHDEENQLERYYMFLTDECKYQPGDFHLVYLKPYKSSPSSYSISTQLYNNLKIQQSITELGYHENIQFWIDSLIHSVKAPVVQQTLYQYLKTIKSL